MREVTGDRYQSFQLYSVVAIASFAAEGRCVCCGGGGIGGRVGRGSLNE